jgi:hypothetical protein
MNRAVIVVALAMACAGCITGNHMPAPPAGSPTSLLIFSGGYKNQYNVNGSQRFDIAFSAKCDKWTMASMLSLVSSNHQKVPIAAGERIFIRGVTDYLVASNVQAVVGGVAWKSTEKICVSTVSFVPEPGKQYDVTAIAPLGGACDVTVTDKATGASAPTYEVATAPPCWLESGDVYRMTASPNE